MRALTPEKCHYPFLLILKKLSPNDRREVINKLDHKGIDIISEFIWNFLSQPYGISKGKRRRLRTKLKGTERDLKYISTASNNWKLRKNRIARQSGGAIATLLR